MKKLTVIVIITSLLIGLYSFYIGMQVMDTTVHVESLESNVITASTLLGEEIQYYVESIKGSSRAAYINAWLIGVLTLINLIAAVYFLYKGSNMKKSIG